MRRRIRALALGLVLCGVVVEAGEALAVVGRPLTPVSYAGVARRTTRRAVYSGAAYGGAAYGGYATAPPSNCTAVVSGGSTVHNCGGTTVTPYYDGGNVVYH